MPEIFSSQFENSESIYWTDSYIRNSKTWNFERINDAKMIEQLGDTTYSINIW